MRLNHLNLTVTDVSETQKFLEKYFGLRSIEVGNDNIAGLFDDDGFVLALMKADQATEEYPANFHVGFFQESEEKVNQINQCLKDDGFDVTLPQRGHRA